MALAWRRAQSGTLVFTNGVFDLLHAGHVALLEAARGEGAALMVGVNDDASVRELDKGDIRPIVALHDRMRLLAAIAAVDCVVPFTETTPARLIEELAPDVLVKGGDYTPESVVGAEFVRQRGGRVVILPLLVDHSTTRIVERIRGTS